MIEPREMTAEEKMNSLAQVRELVLSDYLLFCRWVFQTIYGTAFIQADHHTAIADSLMKLEDSGKGLVINMPPRFGKTEMAVVLWMAYGFARNPRSQYIHTSSGEDLALRNSGAVKGIVTHSAFKELFPNCVLKADSSSKKLWETTMGGGVKASASGGIVTGFGAGRMGWKEGDPFDGAIIIDDPLKPADARHDQTRTTVNENLSQTMRSRRNHPNVPVLLIMQRLCEDDPAQFALDGKMAIDFDHLCLQARQEDGTPLWEEMLGLEEMARMELADRYTFASQYQQTPVAEGGNIVKAEWFKRYTKCPDEGRVILSWDTAIKAGQLNDPSCCTVWVIHAGNYYLKDVIHGKFEYPELKRRILGANDDFHPDITLIEDKASGQSLIQELHNNMNIMPIMPVADKITRLVTSVGAIESGRVFLPEEAHWLADFERELTTFPLAKHDDRVDSVSQFLNYIKLNDGSYVDLLKEMGYDV